MPGAHKIWQLRQCGTSLIVARHSKQIPMPQSGPRGSPLTEVRHACPAIMIAAATVVSVVTEIFRPFTVIVISLGMIWFDIIR
jgi:hypothetical protein